MHNSHPCSLIEQRYSQTLENKSSAGNLPALFEVVDEEAFGAAGGALLHPPKSSSPPTLGASFVLKSPPVDRMSLSVLLAPHPESILLADNAGCGFGGDFGRLVLGSGVAQTSFEPHASKFANPPPKVDPPFSMLFGGGGSVRVEGAALDRLKTELISVVGGDKLGLRGSGCFDGSAKSNRSSRPEVAFAGVIENGCDVAATPELKSPNPLDELYVREDDGCRT